MVENISGLDRFLSSVNSLLAPGGQILLTSVDVRYSTEPKDLAYQQQNTEGGHYFGEIRMRLKYGDITGPLCGWLHLALPAFRGAGAKSRHALWVLAFVRFAIPQAFVFFVADHLGFHPSLDSGLGTRLQQVSDTMVQVTRPSILADQQAAAFASPTAGHPEVYSILTIIWIAGCALFLGRWWFRQYRFARSLRMGGKGNRE